MPILIHKLVQAKVLQNYLVDKSTSEALSAGVITCYKDNARTQLKNWYRQTGTYPTYNYEALPNPLTLSAAGTIVDDDGNDVLPLFYPWSETDNNSPEFYYITVVNSGGQQQFTRQKFPFSPENETPSTTEIPQLKNLIINSRFWRADGFPAPTSTSADGDITVTLTNQTNVAICPSQHDGFHEPDIRFKKFATGQAEQAIFTKFLPGEAPFSKSIRPEFYLRHQCTSVASSGSFKYYQFPISLHIATLDSVDAIFTIWLKSNGTQLNSVTMKILQYMGSGALNSPDVVITPDAEPLTPSSSWQPFQVKFTFPTTLGKDYDQSGIQDSAFYLQLHLPLDQELDISIAIPGVFLGNIAPTTDFSTYDEIDTIINSPRTGDYRLALGNNMFGYVPANDGTIGKSGSAATTRANNDTWPLYNLIYSSVAQTWAPVSGYTGVAKDDFSAGRLLTLTKNLGRVIQGLDPVFVTPTTFTASVATVNVISVGLRSDPPATANLFTLSGATSFTTGDPIQFNSTGTLPSAQDPMFLNAGFGTPQPLTINTTYYVIVVSPTTIRLSYTLEDAIATVPVPIQIVSAGTQPNTIINTNNVLTLTTSQSPVLKAGTAVALTTTGTLPSGLSISTVYYITSNSLTATTVTLSDNLEDALNGHFIPILSSGSGTHTMHNSLGAYSGNSYSTKPPRHQHAVSTALMDAGGTAVQTGGGVDVQNTPNKFTQFDGVEKMSLIQPSTMANVFIKL